MASPMASVTRLVSKIEPSSLSKPDSGAGQSLDQVAAAVRRSRVDIHDLESALPIPSDPRCTWRGMSRRG